MMKDENTRRLESRRLQAEYCGSIISIASMLQDFAAGMNPVVANFMQKAASLREHVSDAVEPFNVAVFGRMKAGKSTLINALVGRRLAITGVTETTATINRLTYGSGEDQLNTFKVHWNDLSPETFPLENLSTDWSGKGSEVLERIRQVKYLELFADAEWLRDVQVTDTPGTDSTVAGHAEIAQQFINGKEADALIYVFNPTARETDEKDLQSFRNSCLSGSTPDNSVAVMHKWDEIYWSNDGDWTDIQDKADLLYSQMDNLVAGVVPVSGPLALIAQLATPDFWQELLDILATFPEESYLRSALIKDILWVSKPAQAALYRRAKGEYDMPWPSFRIMLREIYRNRCTDADAAARVTAKLGGMAKLLTMLDRQFLKQSAVIRLGRTRSRVREDVASIRSAMEQAEGNIEQEKQQLQQIADALQDAVLRSWVEKRIHKMESELVCMKRGFVEIDRGIIAAGNNVQHTANSVELIPWLKQNAARFTSTEYVIALIELLRDGTPLPDAHKQPLYRMVSMLAQDMNPATRAMAEKLRGIIIKSFQIQI